MKSLMRVKIWFKCHFISQGFINFPKSWALQNHPYTTPLNVCSKYATFLSIVKSFKSHDIQQPTKVGEKKKSLLEDKEIVCVLRIMRQWGEIQDKLKYCLTLNLK